MSKWDWSFFVNYGIHNYFSVVCFPSSSSSFILFARNARMNYSTLNRFRCRLNTDNIVFIVNGCDCSKQMLRQLLFHFWKTVLFLKSCWNPLFLYFDFSGYCAVSPIRDYSRIKRLSLCLRFDWIQHLLHVRRWLKWTKLKIRFDFWLVKKSFIHLIVLSTTNKQIQFCVH